MRLETLDMKVDATVEASPAIHSINKNNRIDVQRESSALPGSCQRRRSGYGAAITLTEGALAKAPETASCSARRIALGVDQVRQAVVAALAQLPDTAPQRNCLGAARGRWRAGACPHHRAGHGQEDAQPDGECGGRKDDPAGVATAGRAGALSSYRQAEGALRRTLRAAVVVCRQRAGGGACASIGAAGAGDLSTPRSAAWWICARSDSAVTEQVAAATESKSAVLAT